MIYKHVKWSDEMLRKEALKYNTRGSFQKGSKAYQAALRRGLLDDICSHMIKNSFKKIIKLRYSLLYKLIKIKMGKYLNNAPITIIGGYVLSVIKHIFYFFTKIQFFVIYKNKESNLLSFFYNILLKFSISNSLSLIPKSLPVIP